MFNTNTDTAKNIMFLSADFQQEELKICIAKVLSLLSGDILVN